jgi:transcriptional regulator with XRE-family HTH domain
MTVQVHEFATEGHRLLVESTYSPAEIAKLSGVRRQRVSEWRGGQKRPDAEARAALERAIGIPARTWEAPPVRREPTPKPEASAVHTMPPSAAPDAAGKATGVPLDLEGVDLAGLGLEGLAGLVLRIRALEPTLPPRDRVTALQSEARVLQMHETLRQKAADARAEWLASAEFLAEVRALVAVVPPPAAELRAHLGRLGVVLPAPPSPATAPEDPPASLDDVDELLDELETARGFRVAKEPALALAHVLGLGLDEHADAIAALVVDDSPRTARLLSLLEGADARIIRSALERQMATRDALALPQEARNVVAELLHALGHEDLARTIGGAT